MKYQLKDSNAVGLVTLDAIFAARLTKIVADLPDLKVVATTSVGASFRQSKGSWAGF